MRKPSLLMLFLMLYGCGEIAFHNEVVLPMHGSQALDSCMKEASISMGVEKFWSHNYVEDGNPVYIFEKSGARVSAQMVSGPEQGLRISYGYMKACPCPFIEREHQKNERFLAEAENAIKSSCKSLLTSCSSLLRACGHPRDKLSFAQFAP